MNGLVAGRCMRCFWRLGLAVGLCAVALPVSAQEMDHSKMHMPPTAPAASKPVAKKPAPRKPAAAKKRIGAPAAKPADPHAGHAMPPSSPATKPKARQPAGKKAASAKQGAKQRSAAPRAAPKAVDPHAGHTMPAPAAPTATPATTTAEDHAAMGHAMPTIAAPGQQMDHAAMGHDMPMPTDSPRVPVPVLTDADRIAAFPEVAGHPAHDDAIHSYWLLDRLEAWKAEDRTAIGWEALGWIGTDLDRLWLRSEGERIHGTLDQGDAELLYGRSVARWWDVVAGVRHDFGAGPPQTFAAIGVMGQAPLKFEVNATAYVGQSGQTAARLEAEYDTLLTNRLILQWQAEAQFHGKEDERRGIGAGLGTLEGGLRLRYEFTRKFAPYIGVTWERAYGGTAGFRRAHGDAVDDTRIVAGLRIWF